MMRFMSRLATAAVFGAFLVAAVPAHAEKLACDDLIEVVDALDIIADAMDEGMAVDAETDELLMEVTQALVMIADLEGESDLSYYAEELGQAWDAEDRDMFVAATDASADMLEALRVRDCQ